MIFQFIRMKIHNNHDYIALYFLVDTQSLWISQLKQMITLLLLQKDIYFYHRKNINYKLSSNAYFEEKKIN